MRHMASIGIGNCIGGVHRCGTWPASVSSSSGTEPSTRRMLWQGRRWRQRRRLPSMWHLASIGIGIGGIHRCGSWPASVSSSSGTLDAVQTRRMPWHGRRWRRHRRLPSMWHLASIGIGIGGIHQCGTWPASVSSSSGALDADHALAWPVLASASTTSTRRWAVGVGRGGLHAVVSGQPPVRRGVGRLFVVISVRSMRPSQPHL